MITDNPKKLEKKVRQKSFSRPLVPDSERKGKCIIYDKMVAHTDYTRTWIRMKTKWRREGRKLIGELSAREKVSYQIELVPRKSRYVCKAKG